MNKMSSFEEHDFQPKEYLGFSQQTISINKYVVPIDEEIIEPSYYRAVFDLLRESTENDVIEFRINSNGGFLTTAVMFVNSIRECQATTVAIIEDSCDSAASMIALSCDEWEVKPYSSMNIHSATGGVYGRPPHTSRQAKLNEEKLEKLLRDVYSGFLDEKELLEVINGDEKYFSDVEIEDRLIQMVEWRIEKMEEQEKAARIEAEKPQRKPRQKKQKE